MILAITTITIQICLRTETTTISVFAGSLRYCLIAQLKGKLIDLVLIGEHPLLLTLTVSPLMKFKPEVTKYIGEFIDVAVKILPGNCIQEPASIEINAGEGQTNRIQTLGKILTATS